MGDLEHALADYNEAALLSPNNGDTYSCRGDVYKLQGQFAEAIDDYQRAIQCYGDATAAAYPLNSLAWLLVTCRDPKWRDPARGS